MEGILWNVQDRIDIGGVLQSTKLISTSRWKKAFTASQVEPIIKMGHYKRDTTKTADKDLKRTNGNSMISIEWTTNGANYASECANQINLINGVIENGKARFTGEQLLRYDLTLLSDATSIAIDQVP